MGRLRIGEAGYRYERLRAGDHHDHLICDQCGRVIEFFEARIEALQDEVAAHHGFILLSHNAPAARHLPADAGRARRPSGRRRRTGRGRVGRSYFVQATRMNRRPRRSTARRPARRGRSRDPAARAARRRPPRRTSALPRRSCGAPRASRGRGRARPGSSRPWPPSALSSGRVSTSSGTSPRENARRKSSSARAGGVGVVEVRDDRAAQRGLGVARILLRRPRRACAARRSRPSGTSVSSSYQLQISASGIDITLPNISPGGSWTPIELPSDFDIFSTPSVPDEQRQRHDDLRLHAPLRA